MGCALESFHLGKPLCHLDQYCWPDASNAVFFLSGRTGVQKDPVDATLRGTQKQ